jgi:hypothetical protein
MIWIQRREFITLLGGAAAAWPLAARAQLAERRKRIGWLDGTSEDSETRARLSAFRKSLEALGWIEGRNVEIITRFGANDPTRNQSYVTELLALMPEVIVSTNPPSISALMEQTRTLPIVFPIMSDPVALGYAVSLARPGRTTGFTHFEPTTATKWLELLKRDCARREADCNPRRPAQFDRRSICRCARSRGCIAAHPIYHGAHTRGCRDRAGHWCIRGPIQQRRPDPSPRAPASGSSCFNRGTCGSVQPACRLSMALHGPGRRSDVLRARRA